jgi:hypothetical protein
MNTKTVKLRRPCASCPWRVDAPRSYWDPLHFANIWRACQDDGIATMLCHKSKEGHAAVPCQGWIRVVGLDAIGVRLLVMRGRTTLEEIADRDGLELFSTFRVMLLANKIRPPKRSLIVQCDGDDPDTG